MHYTGMSAMRMFPSIRYDPTLFVASILIATLASVAALGIALRLRGRVSGFAIAARLGSSVVMGAAISGMHYTGLAAARFAPGSFCRAARSPGLGNDTLGIVIGCVANVAGHDRMRIEVADNGDGIQEQNLTRLFAHGFTTIHLPIEGRPAA
jgi:NO-binding membrane sensor protein with MHYT domain